MSGLHVLGRLIAAVFLGAVVIYLLAPIVIVMAVAFSPSPVFELPTHGFSLRWFAAINDLDNFWPSLSLSIQVALISTAISTVLGTLCAIAVARGRFRGRQIAAAFVLSPLMLPSLVIGLACLFAARAIGFRDAYLSLIAAHVIITLPFITRVILSNLALFNFEMIDAARTLGRSYFGSLLHVLVPNIYAAYLTGGLFAFLVSMDNYSMALFLSDATHVTLPIQILKYLEIGTDPSVAAISTIMLLITLVSLFIADRLVGVRNVSS
jgi:putative spermidine/putrescine transport system permease protein